MGCLEDFEALFASPRVDLEAPELLLRLRCLVSALRFWKGNCWRGSFSLFAGRTDRLDCQRHIALVEQAECHAHTYAWLCVRVLCWALSLSCLTGFALCHSGCATIKRFRAYIYQFPYFVLSPLQNLWSKNAGCFKASFFLAKRLRTGCDNAASKLRQIW